MPLALAKGPRMRTQNVLLTAFLLFSLVMIIWLTMGITYGLKHGPRMDAPPIGAGAGATGGANAIGELFAGNKANASAKEKEQPKDAPSPAPAANLIDPTTLEQGFIILVNDKVKRSSASDPIYFASNVTGWNPGDAAFKLTPQSDMKWRLHLTKPKSKGNPNEPIEFKFARGSWDACEVNADLSDMGNRTLPKIDASKLKQGEIPTIEFEVLRWADERPNAKPKGESPATVSIGTLKRLEVQGGVGNAKGQTRDLLVWLPPGYDDAVNASTTYPVLYMHDGQNLFSKPSTAPAEWQMDEVCGALLKSQLIQPIIIVGIPHSGTTRTAEYMPPVTTEEIVQGLPPQGDAHLAWLRTEVMPRVERAFRVKTGPTNTGIGGSSLGGLISLYAGAKHPDTFGLVLAESPSLRFGKNEFGKTLFANVPMWPNKVYLAVGTAEAGAGNRASDDYANAVKALDATLTEAGLNVSRKKFIVDEGATHTEDAWAKRLPVALRFLFGTE
jgi:predicted alpha/beta superfamily hydrolase